MSGGSPKADDGYDSAASSPTAEASPSRASDAGSRGSSDAPPVRNAGYALRSLSLPKFLSGGSSSERNSPTAATASGGSGARRWPFGGRSSAGSTPTASAAASSGDSPFAQTSGSSLAGGQQRQISATAAAAPGRRRWSLRRGSNSNSGASSGSLPQGTHTETLPSSRQPSPADEGAWIEMDSPRHGTALLDDADSAVTGRTQQTQQHAAHESDAAAAVASHSRAASSRGSTSAFVTPRHSDTSGQAPMAATPASTDVFDDARSSPSSSTTSANGSFEAPTASLPPTRPSTAPATGHGAALSALAARRRGNASKPPAAGASGIGGAMSLPGGSAGSAVLSAAASEPLATGSVSAASSDLSGARERPHTAPSSGGGSLSGQRQRGLGAGALQKDALLRLKQRSAVRRSISNLSAGGLSVTGVAMGTAAHVRDRSTQRHAAAGARHAKPPALPSAGDVQQAHATMAAWLKGALVRHAMQRLPLSNLVQEIKDINVFLTDLENDTHQSARPSEELGRQMRARNAARKAALFEALQAPGYTACSSSSAASDHAAAATAHAANSPVPAFKRQGSRPASRSGSPAKPPPGSRPPPRPASRSVSPAKPPPPSFRRTDSATQTAATQTAAASQRPGNPLKPRPSSGGSEGGAASARAGFSSDGEPPASPAARGTMRPTASSLQKAGSTGAIPSPQRRAGSTGAIPSPQQRAGSRGAAAAGSSGNAAAVGMLPMSRGLLPLRRPGSAPGAASPPPTKPAGRGAAAAVRRTAPAVEQAAPAAASSPARLGPSTPGDENDRGTSNGDAAAHGSGAAKPFLRRRSQRISMGRRLDLSAVKPRTNTRLDPNLVPRNKLPPHGAASRPATPARAVRRTTSSLRVGGSRPASPANSPAGKRRPGWGSGAMLPDTRPTPRRTSGIGVGKVKQPVRSRYGRATPRPAPKLVEEEWPIDGGHLDGITASHADVPPLGDLSAGADEAGPLDDLLDEVTSLLSQMQELCQNQGIEQDD